MSLADNPGFFRSDLIALVPVAVGIVLAVITIWSFGFGKIAFGDANDYIAAAKSFVNHTPYPRQSELHPMFRPPLYPLFVAVVWKLFPFSIVTVKLAQALLHGATCFLVYRIVFEVLKKRVPAFLGALICAINPLLLAHTVDFYTEPLHTFMLALGLYFVVRQLKNDERLFLNAGLAGIAFGLAALCRPSALGIIVLVIPVVVLLKFKDVTRRRWISACGLLVIGLFGAIAPWTIYNYRSTGEFILINDGFSYNLWLGNLPETIRIYEGGFKDADDNQRFADYIWGDLIRSKVKELERTDNYSALKLNQREKVWRREALKNFEQYPSISARIILGKARTFWTPFLNRLVYGWKKVVLVSTFVIGVYVLALYGAYVFSGQMIGRDFVLIIVAILIVATLIHMLIAGLVRYRVPYVDAYLSMFAGVALWKLWEKCFTRQHTTAVASHGVEA